MLRDNSARSQQAWYIFLSLGIVLAASAAVSLIYCFMLASNDAYSTMGTAFASLQGLLSLVVLGLTLASAVAFMRWMRRAYYNLAALGIGVEYDDSWAVSGWIIPVVSLYRPYTIMREIWQRTQRMGYGYVTSHTLLRVWWTLFLLRSATGIVTNLIANQVNTLEGVRAQLLWLAGSTVFDLAALFVTMKVIRRIADFEQQMQLQAQVATIGGLPPEPADLSPTAEESYG
ncbi:DUF4328 domain-containing protein [Hymenobacter sp. APR13]|uniref:DUF4328 domain-containing protein n=1 Tax=Hymenobacter sp. APR13 TaxID=1356852 RepID=UPI0004E0822E|nr:DUF4328 domain-containing protein [Hymenobacter sp. APR13]AII50408.1 hypothetical protein N008_00225 [Hymenobacter sp. APR13]